MRDESLKEKVKPVSKAPSKPKTAGLVSQKSVARELMTLLWQSGIRALIRELFAAAFGLYADISEPWMEPPDIEDLFSDLEVSEEEDDDPEGDDELTDDEEEESDDTEV